MNHTRDAEALLMSAGIQAPDARVGSPKIPQMLAELPATQERFVRALLSGAHPPQAAQQMWPTMSSEEREQAAASLLKTDPIRLILSAYDEQAACPQCGARRCHQELWGRFFWEGCEPCAQPERIARWREWMAQVGAAWSLKLGERIGQTHWGRDVELLPSLKPLLMPEGTSPIWAAYLFGPPGTGKTQQAVEVLKRKAHAKMGSYGPSDVERFAGSVPPLPRLHFLAESAFLRSMRPGGGGDLEALASAQALVLDDLGESKATDWAYESLKSLIDERYKRRLPTIFTSNRSPAELRRGGLYDERMTDRIYEMCGGDEAASVGTLALCELTTNYRMSREGKGGLW